MKYYIKKMKHQELGSISSSSSRPSRGRYMYISKDPETLSFFPPLSNIVKNDSSLLPIVPLYNYNIINNPRKIYCNYIYHNDKFFGGTRNEYRIYSNNALELERLYFDTGDILVFRKSCIKTNREDYIKSDNSIKETTQEVYFLECIKDKNSSIYGFLDNIIAKSTIRGAHAIYNGNIVEIEDKIESILRSYDNLRISIDDTVTSKVETDSYDIAKLFNPTSFRDFVMVGYNNLCAITGEVIKYESFMNLEAAHIKPKSHGGTYIPSNGVALSRDIHWAFDKGFFTIKNDLTIHVHEKITSNFLKSYSGKKMFSPENDFLKPDKISLEYHRDNVYGLFLTSGKL